MCPVMVIYYKHGSGVTNIYISVYHAGCIYVRNYSLNGTKQFTSKYHVHQHSVII